ERVREKVGEEVKIIAGVTIFKSLEMLEYMLENVPGIEIPEKVMHLFRNTKDIKTLSINFSAELCQRIKESKLCDGVHFLASRPLDIVKVLDLLKW
ncbi:MAG: methylenetetrahydrofolate reductase, partial [Dictyoglomus sp.]